MIDRLEAILHRFQAIDLELADPAVNSDHARVTILARERATLAEIVERYSGYRIAQQSLADAREMLRGEKDSEMQEYLRAEAAAAETSLADLEAQLRLLLLPKDPNDDRDVILEIKGAEGGDEAELFARDLFNMYVRYAQNLNFKVEVLDAQESGIGGFSRIEFGVAGHGAYSRLKYEGGVHRVQRVPKTETQGRVHTSAATVAVMPEADPVDVDLPDKDLDIRTSTSQGPGGQSVNTTYSKIIITHLPTGLVVSCQDEKSQLKNKEKALRVLRARLYDLKLAERNAAQADVRRSMVRTGNRSEKIRTYNFKENRVTDHRIDLTLYKLDRVIQGELGEIVDGLVAAERSRQLSGDDAA